jgi:serine/threonine protein kinase
MAHIDIKLENILVSDDGLLKLTDFGMVQSLDDKLNH